MGSPSSGPASRTLAWEGRLWDFSGSVGLLGKEGKAPMEPHELDTEALREKTKANTPGLLGPRRVRAFWGRTVRGRHHTLEDDSSRSLHVWFTKSF